jgi:hypothetical protein
LDAKRTPFQAVRQETRIRGSHFMAPSPSVLGHLPRSGLQKMPPTRSPAVVWRTVNDLSLKCEGFHEYWSRDPTGTVFQRFATVMACWQKETENASAEV